VGGNAGYGQRCQGDQHHGNKVCGVGFMPGNNGLINSSCCCMDAVFSLFNHLSNVESTAFRYKWMVSNTHLLLQSIAARADQAVAAQSALIVPVQLHDQRHACLVAHANFRCIQTI
jgi:hypothetical protein